MNQRIRELFKSKNWRLMRRTLGLNQSDFWKPVRVTQSGGSRYESGREAPDQVIELLRLRYVEGIDPFELKRKHVTGPALIQQEADQ